MIVCSSLLVQTGDTACYDTHYEHELEYISVFLH